MKFFPAMVLAGVAVAAANPTEADRLRELDTAHNQIADAIPAVVEELVASYHDFQQALAAQPTLTYDAWADQTHNTPDQVADRAGLGETVNAAKIHQEALKPQAAGVYSLACTTEAFSGASAEWAQHLTGFQNQLAADQGSVPALYEHFKAATAGLEGVPQLTQDDFQQAVGYDDLFNFSQDEIIAAQDVLVQLNKRATDQCDVLIQDPATLQHSPTLLRATGYLAELDLAHQQLRDGYPAVVQKLVDTVNQYHAYTGEFDFYKWREEHSLTPRQITDGSGFTDQVDASREHLEILHPDSVGISSVPCAASDLHAAQSHWREVVNTYQNQLQADKNLAGQLYTQYSAAAQGDARIPAVSQAEFEQEALLVDLFEFSQTEIDNAQWILRELELHAANQCSTPLVKLAVLRSPAPILVGAQHISELDAAHDTIVDGVFRAVAAYTEAIQTYSRDYTGPDDFQHWAVSNGYKADDIKANVGLNADLNTARQTLSQLKSDIQGVGDLACTRAALGGARSDFVQHLNGFNGQLSSDEALVTPAFNKFLAAIAGLPNAPEVTETQFASDVGFDDLFKFSQDEATNTAAIVQDIDNLAVGECGIDLTLKSVAAAPVDTPVTVSIRSTHDDLRAILGGGSSALVAAVRDWSNAATTQSFIAWADQNDRKADNIREVTGFNGLLSETRQLLNTLKPADVGIYNLACTTEAFSAANSLWTHQQDQFQQLLDADTAAAEQAWTSFQSNVAHIGEPAATVFTKAEFLQFSGWTDFLKFDEDALTETSKITETIQQQAAGECSGAVLPGSVQAAVAPLLSGFAAMPVLKNTHERLAHAVESRVDQLVAAVESTGEAQELPQTAEVSMFVSRGQTLLRGVSPKTVGIQSIACTPSAFSAAIEEWTANLAELHDQLHVDRQSSTSLYARYVDAFTASARPSNEAMTQVDFERTVGLNQLLALSHQSIVATEGVLSALDSRAHVACGIPESQVAAAGVRNKLQSSGSSSTFADAFLALSFIVLFTALMAAAYMFVRRYKYRYTTSDVNNVPFEVYKSSISAAEEGRGGYQTISTQDGDGSRRY